MCYGRFCHTLINTHSSAYRVLIQLCFKIRTRSDVSALQSIVFFLNLTQCGNEIKMFLFLFMVIITTNAIEQPCIDNNSIDISDGEVFDDGRIIKNGVTFPRKSVFTKIVDGEFKTYGCLCKVKNCLRKCCDLDSVMYLNGTFKNCTSMPDNDIISRQGLKLSFINTFDRNVDLASSNFGLLHGKPCQEVYLEDGGRWFLQEDGRLYIMLPERIPPWLIRGPENYCIDTFVYEDPSTGERTSRLDALICFAEEQDENHYVLSSTGMLISCVFILVTVAVYAWLPELHNLHGRVLMVYLMCLFVAFLLLAIMQILLTVNNISVYACLVMTFIIYFFLLAGFFWLNVMSFDIWWTFSGNRGMSLENMSIRARFFTYSLYAFGFPTALTVLLIALEFSGIPPHPMLPLIRQQGCFIFGTSKLLYLYGPITILCIANLIFFVLTAIKITQIKNQTSVLKSRESSTHDQQRNDKQRLLLYVKLFVVMGFNWILEVISALYPKAEMFWRFTDLYNVLIGLFVFIIFVCKKKIFKLIKKRYKQLRGDPMSRTQTMTSSRTYSSRDEIAIGAVKPKPPKDV